MAEAFADLARKLGALDLEAAQQRGVTRAAALVKKSTLDALRAQVPSGRLRNMRNARLTARYNPAGRSAHVVVKVQAVGPWQIIESDTKAHTIGPRTRGRRGAGRRAVVTPAGVFRRVRHPGTHGRHPWQHGIETAAPEVPDVVMAEIRVELARQFRKG